MSAIAVEENKYGLLAVHDHGIVAAPTLGISGFRDETIEKVILIAVISRVIFNVELIV